MKIVWEDENKVLGKIQAEGLLALVNSELFAELSKLLKGKVKQAFVFGSRASENYDGSSDLDLLIIADTKKPFIHRRDDFEFLFDQIPELDLLVYTPEEFEKLSKENSTGFWQNINSEKKQIV